MMPVGIVGSAHVAASGQSFSDDFNRANSTGLGANWTTVLNAMNILSNQAQGYLAAAWGIGVWATACDTDDNWSEVTIATYGAYPAVMCRASNSAQTHYVLFSDSSGTLTLRRTVAGVETGLGTYSYTPAAGDVLKITADGSTITGYLNGVQRIQVTDTGITSGKYVGIGGYNTGAARYDDWSGGDL